MSDDNLMDRVREAENALEAAMSMYATIIKERDVALARVKELEKELEQFKKEIAVDTIFRMRKREEKQASGGF